MTDNPSHPDDSTASTPPVKRTWLNHLGLFEGTLSLVFAVFALMAPHTVNHTHLSIVIALSIGLGLGGARHGYSFGKIIGWFVLVGMSSLVVLTLIIQLFRRIF